MLTHGDSFTVVNVLPCAHLWDKVFEGEDNMGGPSHTNIEGSVMQPPIFESALGDSVADP